MRRAMVVMAEQGRERPRLAIAQRSAWEGWRRRINGDAIIGCNGRPRLLGRRGRCWGWSFRLAALPGRSSPYVFVVRAIQYCCDDMARPVGEAVPVLADNPVPIWARDKAVDGGAGTVEGDGVVVGQMALPEGNRLPLKGPPVPLLHYVGSSVGGVVPVQGDGADAALAGEPGRHQRYDHDGTFLEHCPTDCVRPSRSDFYLVSLSRPQPGDSVGSWAPGSDGFPSGRRLAGLHFRTIFDGKSRGLPASRLPLPSPEDINAVTPGGRGFNVGGGGRANVRAGSAGVSLEVVEINQPLNADIAGGEREWAAQFQAMAVSGRTGSSERAINVYYRFM